jgi:hypothetical protein
MITKEYFSIIFLLLVVIVLGFKIRHLERRIDTFDDRVEAFKMELVNYMDYRLDQSLDK